MGKVEDAGQMGSGGAEGDCGGVACMDDVFLVRYRGKGIMLISTIEQE